MNTLYIPAASLLMAMVAGSAAQAQTSAPTPAAPAESGVSAAPAASEDAAPRRTLLKIGTGLTRGFELGGFSGLSVPVVVGAEYSVAPNWSLYGNAFTGLQLLTPEFDWSRSRSPFVRSLGVDAGVRYYYHQAKRQAKGRAAGPFVGNYVALHVPTSSQNYRSSGNSYRLTYDYTAVMGVWGLQRRLGSYGLLDAFVGAGLSNPSINRYDNQSGTFRARRELGIATELGLRLSLVR